MSSQKTSRFTIASLVFLGILVGTFISPLIYSGFKGTANYQFSDAKPLDPADQKIALALQENFINVFKKAQPSVVYIRTNVVIPPRNIFEYYRQVEGAGSGFIIDKEGYIVTNNHVVAGARSIEVIFSDNRTVNATLVGRDEGSDIALIKVPASTELVPAVLGDSDKVEPGQMAFALGSPFGLDSTFTQGIISAKARKVDNSRYSRIQTDASINPGNSGGPLLNIFGEVVGINQSIISPNGQGGSVGIGFAIPINEAKDIIRQLKEEKRVIGKPALGVSLAIPGDSYRSYLNLGQEPGVLVRFVVPGSAAQEAGVKENDFITKANGKSIESPEDLIAEVQETGVGKKMELEIIRNGKRMTITATIGEDLQTGDPG
ncbi:MAG: trypsin-like peptidase domain-containing protein [Leptospiraceae bacterium]|nr:trypsin-like peptidase domain-containing protein [Leptospiraceae bacterium]MCB1305517.1 trypsin-like peptidase domain-containing protein [Leptospiraceae bacterium]